MQKAKRERQIEDLGLVGRAMDQLESYVCLRGDCVLFPPPLLGNDSVNTFPREPKRATIGSLARQRVSKQAFSTIRVERLCFLRDPCRGVIKEQRRSFESLVVRS
jgi:hypothetical protein